MVLMVLTLAEWLVLSAMSVLQGSQIWAEWLCVAHLALEVELMELMASFHRKRGKRPNLQCRSYRSGIAPLQPVASVQISEKLVEHRSRRPANQNEECVQGRENHIHRSMLDSSSTVQRAA